MFDVGWSELMVIGVVALIVVGPKDLPVMFRTLGRFTAKARSMAREFSRAMDDAARESGLNEVSKDLKSMTSAKGMGLDKLQEAAGKFESWDPLKKSATKAKPDTATAAPVKGAGTSEPAKAAATAGAEAAAPAPAEAGATPAGAAAKPAASRRAAAKPAAPGPAKPKAAAPRPAAKPAVPAPVDSEPAPKKPPAPRKTAARKAAPARPDPAAPLPGDEP